MIESKLGCDRKRFPASQPLGGREENLFLHTDMAKQPGSKLIVQSLIDRAGMSHSRLQQPFKPPMVFHKKVCDRSGLFILAWFHPLLPIIP
jgi:hypothetical protein